MNEQLDARLAENGVFFLPWIGVGYENGFKERKLLVLGESHYDEWLGQTHDLDHKITRDCIQEVLERDKGAASLWRYIEQALLNEKRVDGWAPSGGLPLWRQFAFYNFVQSPVRAGPRVRPTKQQFKSSWSPFRAVIEAVRPERVLVCGKRLWGNMESRQNILRDDVQAYDLADGTPVWCLAMVHPSSGGFSWRGWHPKIMAFLNDPADTTASA